MNGIAGDHRPCDIQFHTEKGDAGMLQAGREHETFGDGIDKRARRDASALDIGMVGEIFEIREQDLRHAGCADEVDDIRLGYRAGNGPKAPPDRQILIMQSQSECFHKAFPSLVIACCWYRGFISVYESLLVLALISQRPAAATMTAQRP